jgi:hypothetical protein
LDIAKAYPEAAGINSWMRTVRLNKGKNVQIEDAIKLTSATSIIQHLMTCYAAEIGKPGELIIHYAPEGAKALDFILKYDASKWEVSIEKIALDKMEDKGVQRNWGDNIRRINLKAKSPKMNDKFSFTVASKN